MRRCRSGAGRLRRPNSLHTSTGWATGIHRLQWRFERGLAMRVFDGARVGFRRTKSRFPELLKTQGSKGKEWTGWSREFRAQGRCIISPNISCVTRERQWIKSKGVGRSRRPISWSRQQLAIPLQIRSREANETSLSPTKYVQRSEHDRNR